MSTVFRAALVVALIVFGLFSSYVMWEVGYLGIWRAGLANLGAMQILADLVIMGTLLLALLWRDARTSGRRFWPYVVVTYLAGSFGPLLYLLLGDRRQKGD